MRKTGFTVITGLMIASSFLRFQPPTKVIHIGVIVVSMDLIVVLYWLDLFYQSLLHGITYRTIFLNLIF